MATDLYADVIRWNGSDFRSSSIHSIGYNRLNKTLYVEFQSGPAVYSYEGVQESTFNLFECAPSVGRFYAEFIKEAGYTGEKYAFAYIIPRESDEDETPDEGDDPIQPTVKWLTNPGGDSPILTNDTISLRPLTPGRYSVEYTMAAFDEHGVPAGVTGPKKAGFLALSEADALAQFNAAVQTMEGLTDWTIKNQIVSVTHYFDA